MIAYLQTDCDEDKKEAIRQFVTTYDVYCIEDIKDIIDKKLCEVKICDPAIGSGAFPMGLLRELFFCRSAIEPNIVENAADIKKHIIQNSIYGVDIEKGAIDIARLRFWLSIVVDSDKPEQLPNFDYKFMQGNSLIESFMGVDLSEIMRSDVVGKSKKNSGVATLSFDESASINDIRELLQGYFSEKDFEKKKNTKKQINEKVKEFIGHKTSGNPTIPQQLDSIDVSSNDQFFLWHTWFADVFNRTSKQGFDIVIGNPPYFVYQESHVGEIKDLRKDEDYSIAFGGKLNAYKLFIANAFTKLLSSEGINCFIFQNSFLGDRQATNLRKYILENNKILKIDSFPERDSKKKRVFESVKMSVCISLIQKTQTTNNYAFPVYIWDDKNKTSGLATSFSLKEIIAIDKVDYTIPRLKPEYKNTIIKLLKKKEIRLKCIEGELNVTFHKKYFGSNTDNPTILKGASIQRYYYTFQMSQGQIDYLDEKRYLSEYGKTEKSTHHIYERIAMQGMTGANDKIRLVMSIIPQGYYLANSCNYILPTDDIDLYCLLGFLNSKALNWFFRCFSTNSNVNGYEVDNFPIPKIDKTKQIEIANLVKQVLKIKQENSTNETYQLEDAIDKLIYSSYNLSSDDIQIIEKTY